MVLFCLVMDVIPRLPYRFFPLSCSQIARSVIALSIRDREGKSSAASSPHAEYLIVPSLVRNPSNYLSDVATHSVRDHLLSVCKSWSPPVDDPISEQPPSSWFHRLILIQFLYGFIWKRWKVRFLYQAFCRKIWCRGRFLLAPIHDRFS